LYTQCFRQPFSILLQASRGNEKQGGYMTKTKSKSKKTAIKKTIPWTIIVIAALAVILIPTGGFAFAASQEAHDPFCGSCHTQPESTYLERSTASQSVDLASFHTTEKTRCIDCHSGQGVLGRLGAEMMGAGNALKWYTGTAVQPAPLTKPLSDSNCLKCHDQVTQRGYVPKNNILQGGNREAENGHWHFFLTRWQSQSANAGHCVDCHNGHATDGEATLVYLNQQHTELVCDSCHRTLGRD